MTPRRTLSRRASTLPGGSRRLAVLLGAAAVTLAACTTPGQDLDVRVRSAPVVAPEVQIGAEVGRLLAPDEQTSRAAQRRLVALTGEDRDRLLTYAKTLRQERDPRLLNVLDEHHALPELGTRERIEFLLWKAHLPERFYAMKAQSRLIDMARSDPAPLIARLAEGGDRVDVLSVVLAITKTRSAVPVLLQRYRTTTDPRTRSTAAEALGRIAGEERRPRPSGSPEDIERDAQIIRDWYEEQLEIQRDSTVGDTE
jgi:hypothetical protein